MHFGATLRLLRIGAGVGLRSLAQEIGVSGAYLSRVEHGHDPPPTSDRLVDIARVLGVPTDTLLELANRMDPVVSSWTAGEPAAERFVHELARRRLGAAQLARVLAFVDAEFPAARDRAPGRIADLLDPEHVLLGVRVGSVDDLLELAALRVAPRSSAAAVAQALRGREKAAGTAVGQGLLVPNCAEGSPAAVLVTLSEPLDVPTPDGRPLRVMLALVGLGVGPAALRMLASAAALAREDRVDCLCRARTADEALRIIGRATVDP